jgi:PAS domain S-box-containing protein
MSPREPDPAEAPAELRRLTAARDAALGAAQTAIRDTTRLTRLLTILSEPAPLDILLDRVLSALSELFAADIVVLLDPVGTGSYVPLAAIGLPEDVLHQPLSGAEDGYVAAAMRAGAPVQTLQASADPAVDPHLRELGVESLVWLPVVGTRSVRGVLMLARCRPLPFAHADADLLAAMAYRIALVLEQAQRSHQLEQIVRTGREIGRHLDESTVCAEAVRMLPSAVGADAATLVLAGASGSFHCTAQSGLEPFRASTWARFGERLATETDLRDLQPFLAGDLWALDAWRAAAPPANCLARAVLALPIPREGRLHGILFAIRFTATPFSDDTVQVGMLYAGQTSASLENARLYRVVRDELAERVRAERELRESEERLRLALMGADLAMWDWNVVTGEVRFNDRWQDMLGYPLDRIEPGIDGVQKLIHPDDLARAREALRAHLDGATPYYVAEHRFRSSTGDWIWVLDRGKVTHRDARGRPLRVVGTCLDVSETRKIQAERLSLEQQRQQVWRADSLSRMAGGIAHHFNNLLGAVMGNLELALLELPRDDAPGARVSEAMVAARRAAEIGQLMLAYLGQTGGKKERLDLADATREALSLLLSSVPRNVQLRTDIPRIGPPILAESVHVKQILGNVLANAVEAIGDADGAITIAVGVTGAAELQGARLYPSGWEPTAQSYAALSVTDSAGRLDAATQEQIFEPFFSTKFAGRGLGLSVVLGLVRAHGGAVAVQSEPGRGTTFRLLFPPPVREPARGRTGTPAARDEPPATGLVLVVDDEPAVRRIVQAQLERLGYQVIAAHNGAEAIELFRARKDEIGLVVLDVIMPGMDGWETLATLRGLRPAIPVILASGYEEAQVMDGEHAELPQAFLQKPYELKDLKAALAAARAGRG